MNDDPILLSFADCSARDANIYAESLEQVIKDSDPHVEVERRRNRSDTQDFGATLAILLGSASASAVAAGVAQWIARHSGARVIVRKPDGTAVDAEYLDSHDAARIVEAALTGGR